VELLYVAVPLLVRVDALEGHWKAIVTFVLLLALSHALNLGIDPSGERHQMPRGARAALDGFGFICLYTIFFVILDCWQTIHLSTTVPVYADDGTATVARVTTATTVIPSERRRASSSRGGGSGRNDDSDAVAFVGRYGNLGSGGGRWRVVMPTAVRVMFALLLLVEITFRACWTVFSAVAAVLFILHTSAIIFSMMVVGALLIFYGPRLRAHFRTLNAFGAQPLLEQLTTKIHRLVLGSALLLAVTLLGAFALLGIGASLSDINSPAFWVAATAFQRTMQLLFCVWVLLVLRTPPELHNHL